MRVWKDGTIQLQMAVRLAHLLPQLSMFNDITRRALIPQPVECSNDVGG